MWAVIHQLIPQKIGGNCFVAAIVTLFVLCNIAVADESKAPSLNPRTGDLVCKEIELKSKNENLYFVKEGTASNKNLDVGEFDLLHRAGGELYVKDIFLVVPNRMSLASSPCGNSLCISNKEIKPLCPQSKTYQLSITLDSMLLGPGSFKSNESLTFYDKQGSEFETGFSLVGAIHKPQSSLLASRGDVKKLFIEKSFALKTSIQNTGNQVLKIKDFSEVKNTAGIRFAINECKNRELRQEESCLLQFEKSSSASKEVNQYYEAMFDSNDVYGFGKIIFIKNGSGDVDVGLWHK